jgi:membrane-bound lytic murein transglycosylase B
VDFDGDGRRDLWNATDAIGSVANYFTEHGWRGGEPVAIRAAARGSAPRFMKAGYDTSYRVETLAHNGLVANLPLDEQGRVSLLRLDAVGGYEYWLGLPNFYVITRYNHSSYYAMAVYQLAQALRDRRDRVDGVRLSLR